MARVAYWEKRLIEQFVVSKKQERHLYLLKGLKRRAQFLELLNHSFAFDPAKARRLTGVLKTSAGLLRSLEALHVESRCHFLADSHPLDGKELRIKIAVDELLNHYWGALLICPPLPLVVYKEEAAGGLYLLSDAG